MSTGPHAAQVSIESLTREAGWSGLYREWQSATECTWLTVPVTPEQIERFVALVRAAALEEAAREAEHWQKISRPDHKCGEYIAAAIRAIAAKAKVDSHVV